MSNRATIGGFTQVAQALVVVQLDADGFPIDPVSGVPSTDNTVRIAGVGTPVQAVALFTVDGSGNNPLPGGASVPADAPIQPPQAFVDNIGLFAVKPATGTNYDLSNKGITGFVVGTLGSAPVASSLYLCADLQGGVFSLDLSGNALASVDQILTDLVTLRGEISFIANVNISGGASVAPTQNTAVVAGAGTALANGSYTARGMRNGKPYYNLLGQPDSNADDVIQWDGAQWVILGVGLAEYYVSPDNVAFPWLATFVSGALGVDPAPAVTSTNAAKANLTGAGSTVTTN